MYHQIVACTGFKLVSKACTGFSPNDPFLYACTGFSQIDWNSVFSHNAIVSTFEFSIKNRRFG
jgi:hypothetical protein